MLTGKSKLVSIGNISIGCTGAAVVTTFFVFLRSCIGFSEPCLENSPSAQNKWFGDMAS